MRTLHPDLAAAQKSPPFEPLVRLTACREQPSWASVATDAGATPAVNDMVVADDGSIVRAYITGSAGSRTIYTQRITDPDTESQWTTWSSTVSNVDHLAVALAVLSDGTVRLFYADANDIKYRDSTDDGASWGSEQTGPTVAPASAEVSAIASATGVDVFYTEADGNDIYYSAYSGSWSAAAAWTGTGDAGDVDVAKKGSYYYVVFRKGDREIGVIRFDGATWDNQRTIVPADETSFGWYWPRIWYDAADQVTPGAAGAFRLAAVGSMQSGTVWACHYAESDDGLYWTAPAYVPLTVTTDKPVNIIRASATAYYLADNKYAYKWDGPTSVELSGVKRLKLLETGELGRGELRLYLDNTGGDYGDYGESGATYEALERGSRLKLELGLRTPAPALPLPEGGSGVERWVTWGHFYVEGVRLVSDAGEPYECRLAASNGWAALDATLDETERAYQNLDLDDIMEALCATAGVHQIAIDSSDDFFYTPNVESFTVKAGTALLVALANLTGQFGYRRAYAHFDQEHVMRFDTFASSPSADYELEAGGNAGRHPIWAGLYGKAQTPNHVVIVGKDNYAEDWSSSRIGVYGQQLRRILDRKLPNQTAGDERAAEELLAQDEMAREAWVTCPPALSLELWDVVEVTDAGAGVQAEKFRVCQIEVLLDFGEGTWLMELGLRGTT